MIIKRGKCEILEVIPEDQHKIDNEGTRKALETMSQKLKDAKADEKKNLEN